MSNSSVAENPTRSLADLEELIDKRIDGMSEKELGSFRSDTRKIINRAESRARKPGAAHGKKESTLSSAH
jgi:hypothetical protein